MPAIPIGELGKGEIGGGVRSKGVDWGVHGGCCVSEVGTTKGGEGDGQGLEMMQGFVLSKDTACVPQV